MKKRDFIKTLATSSLGAGMTSSMLISACTPKPSGGEGAEKSEAVPVSTGQLLTLPDLPYGYNALEAVIDATTMEIHHSKHHQGYVNKFKAALEAEGKTFTDFESLFAEASLPDGIRNSGGGHFNHSLFWPSLIPGGKAPSASFAERISQAFGSMDELKTALINGGKSVFGSGWVWLIQDSGGNMKLTTTPNQDNPLMSWAKDIGNPLLGIDVWEHAYYLKYQNQRGSYLENIMSIIDWGVVENRLKG